MAKMNFEYQLISTIHSNRFDEKVLNNAIDRIKNESSSIMELRCILIKADNRWGLAKSCAIEHIAQYPHKAASIVAVANQIDGWSLPRYEIRQDSENERILFRSKVIFEKPGIESHWSSARRRKLSKQRSMVNALSLFSGVECPNWINDFEKEKELPRLSVDSINELSEYCTRFGVREPVYTISFDYPWFTVSCRAANLFSASSPNRSKKIAKRQAASMIIKLLHARKNLKGVP